MTSALAVFPILLAVVQIPQPVDSFRALALHGSDSALLEGVRRGPMEARSAWRQLLALGRGNEDSASLAAAERIAGAVAVAWQDSFLVRQVARFRSLSPAERQATVEADSVRRAGIEAFRQQGNELAVRLWRESLRRFEALSDTSGIATAVGTLGLAFHYAQQYDSALAYLTRARNQAEIIGDYRVLANVIADLGNVHWRQGDLTRARASFDRAREVFERIGDAGGLRITHNSVGLLAWTGGDLAGARRSFDTGLALSRSANDSDAIALFLSNLGGVALEAGDYAQASSRLRDAISVYRQQGNLPQTATTLLNLGTVASRRGDYPSAMRSYTEAVGIFRRLGFGAVISEADEIGARTALAYVRAHMGDLQGARTELAQAEAVASRLRGAPGRASIAELALAQGNMALNFNQFAEAERQYARAHRLARGETAEQKRRGAQVGLAAVLFRRQHYHRAQATLEQLLSDPSVDPYSTATNRLLLGQAAARGGDTATARRAFRHALDTLRALGAIVDEAQALAWLGDLEARNGRPVAAESVYLRGLARLGTRAAPGVAWQLHAGLGANMRRRGRLADAARELRAAIGEIERIAGGLRLEEHRSAFRADKWKVYVDLALVERARGRTEAAFEVSERLRARQMLDLLARGRIATAGAAAGEFASQEQDLRRRIAELSREPDRPEEGARRLRAPARGEAGLTAETLASLQEQYVDLVRKMRDVTPAYAALVEGEIVSARAVITALAPDEALLEYLVSDSMTVVFVATQDTIVALDLNVNHGTVAAQVDFARSGLAASREGTARRTWRAPLRRLYRDLIEPVEESGLLAGKQRLLIVPHAELHYLPFAALVRPGAPEQLLVQRYVIEYVPSASVWLRLRSRAEVQPAAGILALAPRTSRLPGSRMEVAAIRRTYADRAQTLVDNQATETAFYALAPQQEIVHLATYGVLNKNNPLFSFVELQADGEEDGRLEVHEVFGLSLKARLVVLSACQTGVGAGMLADVPPGDDWVGLVQGFLYAGAGNVLATLWPVSDMATASLMEQFYRELAAGRSTAEALAVAQRAALRHPATAHPFSWAGFVLVRGR